MPHAGGGKVFSLVRKSYMIKIKTLFLTRKDLLRIRRFGTYARTKRKEKDLLLHITPKL